MRNFYSELLPTQMRKYHHSINLKYCYITLFMHYFIYNHTLNYIKPIDLQDFVNEAQQRDLW